MQVEHFLERSAARAPEKVALVCQNRRWTYAEIDAEASRLAALLRGRGLQSGDRVAIHMENSAAAVIAIFGALKAGGVFMMINPSTKAEKLAFMLNDSRAAALVCDARRAQVLAAVRHRLPHLSTIVIDGTPPAPFHDDPRLAPFSTPSNAGACHWGRRIDVDLAALIYTSGSTGVPKGVMLTHLNIVSAATSITTYLENVESDVILNALPLSFDYGLYQVLMAFMIGGTVVLERSFAYPHAVLERVTHERVTGFPVVPTMAAMLLQIDLRRYDLRSLRYITSTGAAFPKHHLLELRRLLPGVRIYSMYGLTECKRVSYLAPEDLEARPESVGQPMPNQEAYIVDEQDRRLWVGIGELVIRGSSVMRGYWERPEETARVLRLGPLPGERVLYTGDIFRMDADGYLYFIGRRDDIIKTRGEKVSPKEVENVLCGIEGVAEAAVFGVPDEMLGEAVGAAVTLKAHAMLTAADILRHCAERLEDFMRPRHVRIIDAMPKSPNGKVLKAAAAAMVLASAPRQGAA